MLALLFIYWKEYLEATFFVAKSCSCNFNSVASLCLFGLLSENIFPGGPSRPLNSHSFVEVRPLFQ